MSPIKRKQSYKPQLTLPTLLLQQEQLVSSSSGLRLVQTKTGSRMRQSLRLRTQRFYVKRLIWMRKQTTSVLHRGLSTCELESLDQRARVLTSIHGRPPSLWGMFQLRYGTHFLQKSLKMRTGFYTSKSSSEPLYSETHDSMSYQYLSALERTARVRSWMSWRRFLETTLRLCLRISFSNLGATPTPRRLRDYVVSVLLLRQRHVPMVDSMRRV